ncbi:MAG: ABC transporter ATP-binding protein, partial [Oscillospiraceae bacterium]|nr:ABC transporter ATP-binding protein [Oscillospiraceae bacterium]
MKKQSKLTVLLRMGKLVRPLTGFMLLAVLMGTFGFLCAQFIPILGGFAVLHGLKIRVPLSLTAVCVLLMVIALLRAVLRYGEQRTNHYIAFTL